MTTTRMASLVALALTFAGCAVPSVPVPPPEPNAMIFDLRDDGTATYRADATDTRWGSSIVYVLNADVGIGVIVTAESDGSVAETPPFPGVDGDVIRIRYETADDVGSQCVFLHQGRSSDAAKCK
jgi:hypothetical protein